MIRNSYWALLILFSTANVTHAQESGAAQPSPEEYFLTEYESARQAFRDQWAPTNKKFSGVQTSSIPIAQPGESDLTIDTLYVPAQGEKSELVIISSGVHGTEAATGSAVQRLILREMLLVEKPILDLSKTGILFIHAVNPFGFKHGRRVSGSNVDLNRNFSEDPATFSRRSPGYQRLNNLLNPQGPADSGLWSDGAFAVNALINLIGHSMGELTQSIAQGQYELPQGIFFGGLGPEPQVALLRQLLIEVATPYKNALVIDLHTGYGRKGFMHLMPNPPDSPATGKRMKAIFSPWPVELTGDGGNFYSNDGDFSTFGSAVLKSLGKVATPMLFEFGTVDSQSVKGSLVTIRRVILENQSWWHGAKSDQYKAEIGGNFRDLFLPQDAGWRQEVLRQIREEFPRFVAQFQSISTNYTRP